MHNGTTWLRTARFQDDRKPIDALRAFADRDRVDAAGLASVVPAQELLLSEAVRAAWGVEATIVDATSPLPFRVAYETPETLGADRLAAAAAAFTHFTHGVDGTNRSVVVLDAGTALTTEVITADGCYLGGAIMPGPELARASLSRGTALLPEVPLILPHSPVGRSTTEALQAGLLFSFLDGVRGLLARTFSTLDGPTYVVATGGWGTWLADRLELIDHVEPHLVLDGIRLLAEAPISPQR